MYGVERWYAFSVYIDPSWVDTSTDPNGTVVFATHSVPDTGEGAKSGNFAIEVSRDSVGPYWEVRSVYDANAISTSSTWTRRDWNVGPVQKGVWVDWVIYGKWSYGSDGVLKVWKNGVLVVNNSGPNTYNDQNQQFVELGIYKSWWGVKPPTTRQVLTAYFDEVKIGDQSLSYEEVAPKAITTSIPASPTSLSTIVK
jgi:hypothetical protein